jgi:hypothetical protein
MSITSENELARSRSTRPIRRGLEQYSNLVRIHRRCWIVDHHIEIGPPIAAGQPARPSAAVTVSWAVGLYKATTTSTDVAFDLINPETGNRIKIVTTDHLALQGDGFFRNNDLFNPPTQPI